MPFERPPEALLNLPFRYLAVFPLSKLPDLPTKRSHDHLIAIILLIRGKE